MTDTNYIGSVVKILETPKKKIFKNNIQITQFRAQLPQIRKTKVINLVFWGKLGYDVLNYYQVNDYILIEGYLSLSKNQLSKKIEVTVLKIYPFLVGYNNSTKKG